MLLTEKVEVRPTGKMIQYYKDKGYDAKYRQSLMINVKDLPKSSFVKVDVLCDYCKEHIFSITYHSYNEEMKCVKKHACKNCWQKKTEEIFMVKYGVKNPFYLKSIQEKRKETMIANYGVDVPLKSEKIKKKQMQTILNNYNVENISQLKEIKERKSQTALEHFGVDNPSKSNTVKEKICITNIKKYGTSNPMQSSEIRAKANETLCKNCNQKTSKQQLYLHSLFGGEINYPVKQFALDVCFPEEKIYVEYSGGGHDLRVTLGQLTQEEFNQKEIIRNNILKREGYKKIEIVSKDDKLPNNDILLQMLSESRNYFNTTSHSWCTYDIDKSLLINAENKQGISYDFGTLRRIK